MLNDKMECSKQHILVEQLIPINIRIFAYLHSWVWNLASTTACFNPLQQADVYLLDEFFTNDRCMGVGRTISYSISKALCLAA